MRDWSEVTHLAAAFKCSLSIRHCQNAFCQVRCCLRTTFKTQSTTPQTQRTDYFFWLWRSVTALMPTRLSFVVEIVTVWRVSVTREDMYAQDSIELLTTSGIQFKKHEDEGIETLYFAELLMTSGVVLCDGVKWLSFHRYSVYVSIFVCSQVELLQLHCRSPAWYEENLRCATTLLSIGMLIWLVILLKYPYWVFSYSSAVMLVNLTVANK